MYFPIRLRHNALAFNFISKKNRDPTIMTPFTMQMTAAMAVAMLAAESPAYAALQPSSDVRLEMASVPMPPAEQFSTTGKSVNALFRQAAPRSAQDAVEAERRNLLLAPPADEALHLYVASAIGFIVIALLMLAMLSRKPRQGPSAGA